MTGQVHEPANSFSLFQGGLLHRATRWLRFKGSTGLGPTAVLAGVLAFVPLVILAAMQDVLYGSRVALPLLSDWSALSRFAIAVPLLILAGASIDRGLAVAVEQFRSSGIVRGKTSSRYESALADVARSRDSLWPEVILLVIAFSSAWISSYLTPDVSSWRVLTPGVESSITMANRWLNFVSLPLFRLLVLLWFWRIFVWSRFLYRVARMDLELVPTHPDGAAGLAFLGLAQTAFAAFLVPISLTVGARGVLWVQHAGGTFDSLRYSLLAFVLIALVLALGPLLVFVPRLARTKWRGLVEYATLGSEYTRRFDQKWIRGGAPAEEPLLGTADIQTLADLGNSYAAIRNMRLIPATFGNALTLTLAAFLPLLPTLAIIVPIEKILNLLLQLLV